MGELVQAVVVRTGGTPVRDVDYAYDALNRLTSETVVGATATTYTYDSVGNRLAKDACTGDPLVCETTTYAYNANNQLLTEDGPDSDTAYFYDTNGSLVEKDVDDGTGMEVTTYAYDSRNRMIGAETPDDDLGFVYDVDGIRVAKTVNGVATSYLIDKIQPYAQVVEERSATGTLVASYTYGNDLISQYRGTSTAYYAYDGLGSTRALTDASGAVTDTYMYEAFGSIESSSGMTANAYLFTGEQWDAETGLEYLRSRYYSPLSGRFLILDQCRDCDQRGVFATNKYLYSDSNPVSYIDPNGEFTVLQLMITLSVAITLYAIPLPSFSLESSSRVPWTDVSFSALKAAYPDESPCPSDKPQFKQFKGLQCAIKMSHALRSVGLYSAEEYEGWGAITSLNYVEPCRGLARNPWELALWLNAHADTPYKYAGEGGKKTMALKHKTDQGIFACENCWGPTGGHIGLWEGGWGANAGMFTPFNPESLWFFYLEP